MFIVWRGRPVLGDGRTPFLTDIDSDMACNISWRPLYCEHRGEGRIAWPPPVMHSERRDGGPRQRLSGRLPTIRSCCIEDGFCRAAWWYDVAETFKIWGEEDDPWPGAELGLVGARLARDTSAMVVRLRERIPEPTRDGKVAFEAPKEMKEKEEMEFLEARRAEWQRQGNERARWRRAEEDPRRLEDAIRDLRGRLGDPGCFGVLDLTPLATPEQVKASYRRLAMQHHPRPGR